MNLQEEPRQHLAELKEQIAQWHVYERVFLPLLTQMERFLGAQTPTGMCCFASPQVDRGSSGSILSTENGYTKLYIQGKLPCHIFFFYFFP